MGELEAGRERDLETFCKNYASSLPDAPVEDEEEDEDELEVEVEELDEDLNGDDEELQEAESYEEGSGDEDYDEVIANLADLQREKIELDLRLMSLYHRIESITQVLTVSINHISSRTFLSSQQLATARACFPPLWGKYSSHFKEKVRAKIALCISDIDSSRHWNDIVRDIVNQPRLMAHLGLSEASLRVTEIAHPTEEKVQRVAGMKGRSKKVFAAVACWCRDEELRKCYVEFFQFLFGREEDPNQFVSD